jgi:hypothetical protein
MSAGDVADIAVPDLDAPWSEIWLFATTYDAYARHGGFTGAAQLGNAVHDRWRLGGTLPDDLTTLRAALSFQERRFDHFGVDPQGEDARYVLALLARIRALTAGTLTGPLDTPVTTAPADPPAPPSAVPAVRAEPTPS